MSKPLTASLIEALAYLGIGPTPSVTWANRPTSPRVGQRIRATSQSNREYYWDGTVWQPLGPNVLAQETMSSAVTGTTSETQVASLTLPGGMQGPKGIVVVRSLWNMTGASTKNLRVRIGGVLVQNASVSTQSSAQIELVFRNAGSQSSQVLQHSSSNGSGTSSASASTATIDTSVDQSIQFSGLLTDGADSITLRAYDIQVRPA